MLSNCRSGSSRNPNPVAIARARALCPSAPARAPSRAAAAASARESRRWLRTLARSMSDQCSSGMLPPFGRSSVNAWARSRMPVGLLQYGCERQRRGLIDRVDGFERGTEGIDRGVQLARRHAVVAPAVVENRGRRPAIVQACPAFRSRRSEVRHGLGSTSGGRRLRAPARCPAKLPLSTVEIYFGSRGRRSCVSYQL